MDDFAKLYGGADDPRFDARYEASCHCGRVRYQVSADPVDAKICHCVMCRKLHGAPMQWAAIFHKHHVRFVAGVAELRFYNGALDNALPLAGARGVRTSDQSTGLIGPADRSLPCKVSCRHCGAPIADEGRTMWLGFPPLFDFGTPPAVPEAFKPTCHIFYAARVLDMDDGLPKWAGHAEGSERLG